MVQCGELLHEHLVAPGEMLVAEAMVRRRRLGTSEFFVSSSHMLQLLRQALQELPRPVLSLNRPQVGGGKLVHRLEWRDLVFTCVTRKPLTIA
jgi:hypothetical protein